MNWLDIALMCLAAIGFVKGLFDGVVKQVVSLIALLAGIYFCAEAAGWVKGYILRTGWFPPEGVTVLSYVLGFLLIVGLLMLAGEVVHRVIGATPLGALNHIAGAFFGLLVVTLFTSLLLNVLEPVDRGGVWISRETKIESRLYYPVKEILPTIFPHNLFSLGEEGYLKQ